MRKKQEELYSKGYEALDQVAQRGGHAPPLKTFKVSLHSALRNLI